MGSKITANGDYSHEIERRLLLRRKTMTDLDSISKSTGINLLTDVHLARAIVFLVIMYRWESWTIKKADAKELMLSDCWGRLLRVPWTARISNQSTLKEISPEYSLEGLMLKLKLQYFGLLKRRVDSFEKPWCWERLRAGEGEDRGGDHWRASPSEWTWIWVNSGSWWWTGWPGVLWFMRLQRVRHD